MRIPFLALALLFVTPAFSQLGVSDFNVPAAKLASPSTPNPQFPLRVSLRVHDSTWDYTYEYYAGYGKLQIVTSDPAKPINFEYQCGVSFSRHPVNKFQARWIKPDKILQVLLYDPERPNKPRTCNLNVLVHPPQTIPPA